MLREDIKPGQCFRYVGSPNEPFYRKLSTEYLVKLPSNSPWSMASISFYKGDLEVELLEHYSTHPIPIPLKIKEEQEVKIELLRKDIQPGQCFRYVGDTQYVDAYYYPQETEDRENIRLPIHPKRAWRWFISTNTSKCDSLKVQILHHYTTHPVPTLITGDEIAASKYNPIKSMPCTDIGLIKSRARQASDKMARNDSRQGDKLTQEERDAWSTLLWIKVNEQKEKDLKAIKDKEVKVELEFEYWE